jgi:hypothetical protein
MGWATFWANISQSHLVTLPVPTPTAATYVSNRLLLKF